MRRLFGELRNNQIQFNQDTLKHIKVIRLNKGENIEVVINNEVYICMVTNINHFEIKIIEKQQENSRELPINLILCLPLLKRENFELVLQKATELGVNIIYPYISSRVIKRLTEKEFEQKRERYEKILINACEQSNRTNIPKLETLKNIEDLPEIFTNIKNKYIPFEDEAIGLNKIDIIDKEDKNAVIICGPEGGFSKQEVDMFKKENFKVVSLGKRILRAETANIYALSIINYLFE